MQVTAASAPRAGPADREGSAGLALSGVHETADAVVMEVQAVTLVAAAVAAAARASESLSHTRTTLQHRMVTPRACAIARVSK
jgi:hypothetical protein